MATDRLNRINELAKKAKTEGLTPQEEQERDRLRKEYLAAFRANLQSQLDSVVIVDPQGNRTKLKKKNGKK
ncbi:MAG: DUF896 domain-containing protein [Oscillospiraceae bacterium]|nr:DUF896 domain-containing protein [Oscillospiraceae bacterium]